MIPEKKRKIEDENKEELYCKSLAAGLKDLPSWQWYTNSKLLVFQQTEQVNQHQPIFSNVAYQLIVIQVFH